MKEAYTEAKRPFIEGVLASAMVINGRPNTAWNETVLIQL
jgi:hypothetical protein